MYACWDASSGYSLRSSAAATPTAQSNRAKTETTSHISAPATHDLEHHSSSGLRIPRPPFAPTTSTTPRVGLDHSLRIADRIPNPFQSTAGQLSSSTVPALVDQTTTPQTQFQTLNRNNFPTLCSLLHAVESHALFNHSSCQASLSENCCQPCQRLEIVNLNNEDFSNLYDHLRPTLESSRTRISFDNHTLIIRHPSDTHESSVIGWSAFTSLLASGLDIPNGIRQLITWSKGQVDSDLPNLMPGISRKKCPDCSLGPQRKILPTLVLETGYSETGANLNKDAQTWLLRPLENDGGGQDLERDAVQCVILLKFHQIKSWLQSAIKARDTEGKHNLGEQEVPNDDDRLVTALTVSIWRNEVRSTTGKLQVAGTSGSTVTIRRGNRPAPSVPICISRHIVTRHALVTTDLNEYLNVMEEIKKSEPDLKTNSNLPLTHLTSRSLSPSSSNSTGNTLQDQPPIPRSSRYISSGNTPYFTIYLDDLLAPSQIPSSERRGIWVNIPVKVWIWSVFRCYGMGDSTDILGILNDTEKDDDSEIKKMWSQWREGNKEKCRRL